MRQRDAFAGEEGDRYHRRNRADDAALAARAAADPLLALLDETATRPRSVLEIGAGDGWRLAWLRRRDPAVECVGLEPSGDALADGSARFPDVRLVRGTAERLPFPRGRFDLVLFGFVLYLCDRDDLFAVAAEAHRVLADGGRLGIYDFQPPRPYRNPYRHRPGLWAYKADHAAMFLWNPAYRVVARRTLPHPGAAEDDLDARVGVVVLERDDGAAYADGPPPP